MDVGLNLRKHAKPRPRPDARQAVDQDLLERQAHLAMRWALYIVALMRGADLARPAAVEAVRHGLERIVAIMSVVRGNAFQHEGMRRDWQRVAAVARPQADPKELPSYEGLRWLEHGVRAFISTHWQPWQRARTYLVETLAKNATLGAGIGLWAAAVALAEPVRSLFLDHPIWFLTTLACTGVPPIVLYGATLQKRRGTRMPIWAHDVFFLFGSRRPEGIELYPSAHWPLRLAAGALIRTAVHLIWLVLLALLWWAVLGDHSSTRLTVAWSSCALAAGLACLHLLDLWRFVDPHPTRSLTLAALGAGAIAYSYDPDFVPLLWWACGAVALLFAAVLVVKWRKESLSYRVRVRLPPLLMVGIALVTLVRLDRTRHNEAWRSRPDRAPRALISADAWPHRPPRTIKAPPVVIVAASGGGSRAAIYTARTLSLLDGLCPSEARCDRKIGDHLQLISSVSGGSLASAAYVARRLKGPVDGDDLAAAVQTDFLQPVLIGAIAFGTSRGAAIEASWRDPPVALGRVTLGEIAKRWRATSDQPVPAFPLPIFNSATLDGYAVAITPLPWESYNGELHRAARDPKRNLYQPLGNDLATWVYYRSGSYGLESFTSQYDPLLSEAVRASANFPFGFPLVEIETDEPAFYSPVAADRASGRRIVRLTDGGVVSNSGMWTLYPLLDGHAASLKERGVLLVIVDASRMPGYSRRLSSTIGDQAARSRHLHRRMLDALYHKLDKRLAVVQIDLPPLERNNAYTSWALDEATRTTLDESFAERSAGWRDALRAAWRELLSGGPCSSIAALQRLPSD